MGQCPGTLFKRPGTPGGLYIAPGVPGPWDEYRKGAGRCPAAVPPRPAGRRPSPRARGPRRRRPPEGHMKPLRGRFWGRRRPFREGGVCVHTPSPRIGASAGLRVVRPRLAFTPTAPLPCAPMGRGGARNPPVHGRVGTVPRPHGLPHVTTVAWGRRPARGYTLSRRPRHGFRLP